MNMIPFLTSAPLIPISVNQLHLYQEVHHHLDSTAVYPHCTKNIKPVKSTGSNTYIGDIIVIS